MPCGETLGWEEGGSQEAEIYDAGKRWLLGLPSKECAVGDIGGRARLDTLYICKREGRLHHLEGEQEAGTLGNGEESV